MNWYEYKGTSYGSLFSVHLLIIPLRLHPKLPAVVHHGQTAPPYKHKERASKVSTWPQKPLFHALFGTSTPERAFSACIKISRIIETAWYYGDLLVYADTPTCFDVVPQIETFKLFLCTFKFSPVLSNYSSWGGSSENHNHIWISPKSKKVLAAGMSIWTPYCQNSLFSRAFPIGKNKGA